MFQVKQFKMRLFIAALKASEKILNQYHYIEEIGMKISDLNKTFMLLKTEELTYFIAIDNNIVNREDINEMIVQLSSSDESETHEAQIGSVDLIETLKSFEIVKSFLQIEDSPQEIIDCLLKIEKHLDSKFIAKITRQKTLLEYQSFEIKK